MQLRSLFISALSIAMVASALPATQADPLVEVIVGTPLFSDFEDGEQGWTANPPAPAYRPVGESTWEWGTPTSGPGFAASGSRVWATNLDGVYSSRDCGAILSPPIDLNGATSASVSFKEWHHIDQSTSTTGLANDGGRLYVTTDGGLTLSLVDPAGGYTSKRLGSVARGCLDDVDNPAYGISGPQGTTPPAAVYSTITTDLSAFSGQTVQFLIAFASDSFTHRAGWYVDDFAVTIDDVTTVEDFETSDGGFTVVSTYAPIAPHGFSHGVPGAGPASDSPMWATNPAGNYGHKECAWVESPAFLLGDSSALGLAGVRATLSWDQFFRGNSLYSAGIVQIGVKQADGTTAYEYITPDTGYNGEVDSTYADQLMECLGVELDTDSFESTLHLEGSAMRSYRADLSDFLGEEITVRYHFTSAWSSLNPTLYSGWYIDNVAVDLTVSVEDPNADDVVADLLATKPTPVGWTSGGAHSTWEYGVATVGPAGELVFGTNLTGNHHRDECSYAETPELPASLLVADPMLTFEHWYDIYPASASGAAWSGAAVLVSTDSGATWKYLDLPEYDLEARYSDTRNCLLSMDPTIPAIYPRVFSGQNEAWETVGVDLSEFADSPTVKVRFVFSSGISIYREGYYLRSAELGGVKIL